MSLSSPGHAVSLFRGEPFWEGFWVRSRGFAHRDAQTQLKVPTVHFEGNWRCKLSPTAAKSSFFIGSGRDVWHWRSLQRRSKKGVLELARPCCFPVSGRTFWEAFWVRSRGLARHDALTLKVHLEANSRCKLYPKARKTFFFRFWTQCLPPKHFRCEVVALQGMTPKHSLQNTPSVGATGGVPRNQHKLWLVLPRHSSWKIHTCNDLSPSFSVVHGLSNLWDVGFLLFVKKKKVGTCWAWTLIINRPRYRPPPVRGSAASGRQPLNPAAPSLKQIYSFAKRGRLYAADPFSEVCATRRPLVGAKTCEAWNSEVTGGSVTEANLALLRGDRVAPPTPSAALPGTSQATGGSLQALIGGVPVPGRIQLFQRNGVAKMEWVPRRPLGRAFSSKFWEWRWTHEHNIAPT